MLKKLLHIDAAVGWNGLIVPFIFFHVLISPVSFCDLCSLQCTEHMHDFLINIVVWFNITCWLYRSHSKQLVWILFALAFIYNCCLQQHLKTTLVTSRRRFAGKQTLSSGTKIATLHWGPLKKLERDPNHILAE